MVDRGSEVWYRRAARGACAGGIATAVMSLVQFPGALVAGRFPPPVEVTKRLHDSAGQHASRSALFAEGVALHLAFGAACGALYALVAPRRFRELTATAYSALIYGAGYRGYLPALGLHPHSERDDIRRRTANATGHVVYGLTLAEILRWTDPDDRDDNDVR